MTRSGSRHADPPPPAVIGDRYHVERELGHGGMSRVYLCRDSRDDSQVAVKILRPEISSEVVIERFLREIDFVSELDHPQIPKVLDSGVVDGLPFYVMTYIEGESLRDRLTRERQLTIAEAVRIATAIADPATYAHRSGIVHRDIKPENILLAGDAVYVLDFGIARAIMASAGESITSTGIAVGTPAYMSPEQALSDGPVDARSDVYSLGCVTYEMIAGIPPFVGATAQSIMARRLVASPPPLSEIRENVPPYVERAVTRALAKSPADRTQSVREFAEELQDTGIKVTQVPGLASLRKSVRHRKTLFGALIGLPVIVGLGLASFALAGRISGRRSVPPILDPTRIAVLYFDDHSQDGALSYLAGGLTESLIHELSSVPAIRVVSRNGVKPFRNRAIALDSVASLLKVGSLVEGSVQQSGDRVRVTAQLVDAASGTRLESTTLERNMDELFKLEDELAQDVSGMLRRRIGRAVNVKRTFASTSSGRARELVFRADQARGDADALLIDRDSSDRARGAALLIEADRYLAEAERADGKWIGPVIRRGWVALDAALRQGGTERRRSFERAWSHSARAIARAPNYPEAIELRGTILYYRANRLPLSDADYRETLRRAAQDLQKVVSLDSTRATAWGTLSRVRRNQGDFARSVHHAERALRTDAFLEDAADVLVTLYAATLMQNIHDRAWTWCLRGRREFPRDPRFVECQLTLLADDHSRKADPDRAWALVKEGDRLDPPAEAARVGRPFLPLYRVILAAAVSARAGHRDSARAVAARTRDAVASNRELRFDVMYEDAYIDLLLGDRRSAVNKLTEYHSARPSLAGQTVLHSRWAPLLKDTAFANMLNRAGAAIR